MEKKKEDSKFKLYINSQNKKKVWEAIEYAKSQGLNPSAYICSKIIQGHVDDSYHPMAEPEPAVVPVHKKNHLIYKIVDIAKEYAKDGIDGLDFPYTLPHMFNQSDISKEDMIDIVNFAVKLYMTIVCIHDIKNIILKHPDEFLNSKKDIQSKYKVEEFRRILNLELLDDIDRKILYEEQKQKEEMEERNRKMMELNRQKLQIEKAQWQYENPGREYWTKGMTDEEIETSNKLMSGEWEIVTDEPQEGDDSSTFI